MKQNSEKYAADLADILRGNTQLMDILNFLYVLEPNAYLAAGVIRNSVWAALHQQEFSLKNTEIDVIFYDESDVDATHAQFLQQQLMQHFPEIEWDMTNQAFVHHWYRKDNGEPIAQLSSIAEALSLWPETATAIAVHLNDDAQLEYIAPFGLTDLFELKLRWNKALVSYEVFMHRLHTKKFLEKWAKLKLIE